MRLLTITLSGKHSDKEVRQLQSKLYDILTNHLNGYVKQRTFGDKSLSINLIKRNEDLVKKNEELEAWLKSRSYHE